MVEIACDEDEHGWRRAEPRTAEEVFQLAASLSTPQPGRELIFRGQGGDEWTLTTRIARVVEQWWGAAEFDAVVRLEGRLLSAFRKRAHLFLPESVLPPADRPLAWMALMQHHGGPTRLLDWTRSVYVALYYAASSHPRNDGYVWALKPSVLARTAPPIEAPSAGDYDEAAFREFCCRGPGLRWISTLAPSLLSDRMHAQQGLFLFSNDPTADLVRMPHDGGDGEPDRIKVVVAADLKAAVRQVLIRMNLTAATLFPGIDGLGRLVQEIAETDAAYD